MLIFGWDEVLVQRAVWRGHIGLPKHNLMRTVPLPPSAMAMLRGRRGIGKALVFSRTGRTGLAAFVLERGSAEG